MFTKISETLDLWVSVLAHPGASSLSGQKKRQLSSSFQGKSIYSCRHRRSAPPCPTSMMLLLFHSWGQNFCRSYYLCNLRRGVGGGGRDGQGGTALAASPALLPLPRHPIPQIGILLLPSRALYSHALSQVPRQTVCQPL